MYVHVPCTCRDHKGQKKVSAPLELELQLWATMWMLGIKPQSSARAVSSLNWWAISPAPLPFKKKYLNKINLFKSHDNNEKYRSLIFQTKDSIVGCSLWQACSMHLENMDVQTPQA